MTVTSSPKTILIYAPVPLYRAADGSYLLEDQAINGLRLWAENFDRVIMMMPVESGAPPPAWIPIARVGPAIDRIEFLEMPVAWRPDRFLRHLPSTRRRIREAIDRADYLSFAIGGLFGDWGAVGCLEARRMGRPYAVWTDRVESMVTRNSAANAPRWRARLRARLTHRPMAWLERHVISGAAVGLFHGRETYDAYAPFARVAKVVHNIHLSHDDHIPREMLAIKTNSVHEGPLRLVYVGRVDPMKGPLDWIAVLERLTTAGIEYRATWLGDGAEIHAMRERIAVLGLEERVAFPGFVADRAAVLAALRDAHGFLFCHKTPESPRVLIEALASGTPVLGYDGAFARDLIAGNGGGALTTPDDIQALTESVAALAKDRTRLAGMMGRAAQAGAKFTDREVFAHRSALIRQYLPSGRLTLPAG